MTEIQAERITKLEEENRALKDENARLKGGNSRPQIKPSVKERRDLPSGGKEKGSKNNKR